MAKPDGSGCPDGDDTCLIGASCQKGVCTPGIQSRYGIRLLGNAGSTWRWNDVEADGTGAIVVGSSAVSVGRTWQVARVDRNGAPRTGWPKAFGNGKVHAGNEAVSLEVAANGTFWVAGTLPDADGVPRASVLQIAQDGTVEPTVVPNLPWTDASSSASVVYHRDTGGGAVLGANATLPKEAYGMHPGTHPVWARLAPRRRRPQQGRPSAAARRAQVAAATSIAGTWAADGGGPTITIPDARGGRFDVEFTTRGGRATFRIPATWSQGMRGNQLRFEHHRRLFTVTWTGQRPHQVQVMIDGGRAEIFRRMER